MTTDTIKIIASSAVIVLILSILYIAIPASHYDEQIATFENSAKTLKVANAADITMPEFPLTVAAVTAFSTATVVTISRFRGKTTRL